MQLHSKISQSVTGTIAAIKTQWEKVNSPYRFLLRVKVPLFEKKEIAETILNTLQDCVLAINSAGYVIYANNQSFEFFGLNSHALLGQLFHEALTCFSEVELDKLRKTVEHATLNQGNATIELNGKDSLNRPRIFLVDVSKTVAEDSSFFTSLMIKDISKNEVLRYENDFLKTHDLVTGVFNREAFLEKLQRSIGCARRYNIGCAVIFLGLDGFAMVNQAYGYKRGDLILREVAKRIQSVIRDTDIIARFEGDEFLVLLDRLSDPLKAGQITEYIIHAIQQPFHQDFEIDFINISAGLALYPQDEKDPVLLMQCAKMGLLEAKEKGKGAYQYYQDNWQTSAQRKIIVANELRKSLKLNQLDVYFQPLVHSKTLKLLAIEALARWHHPLLGYIAPQEFISVAEEVGFISMLGRYIFTVACQHYANWKSQTDLNAHFKLAVNLSVKEFFRDDFVEFMRETVNKYSISPTCVQLEITESIFVNDMDLILRKLQELKEQGFEVALDDFGTGYSCLSILSTLPVDVIKIDKSFADKLTSSISTHQAIVGAIVDLAKNLKMQTVAEGIETVEQQNFMREVGVDILQGYLFAKPMSHQEMYCYLKKLDKH